MLKPLNTGTLLTFETPEVEENTVLRMDTTAGIAWYEWTYIGWKVVPKGLYNKFEAEYQQSKEKQND